MAKPQHDLVALVHDVQGLVDGLPRFDFNRPAPYRDAEQRIVDELRAKGARITIGSDVSIVFGGVRSASTGGTSAAVRNWIGAARRKLDKQAIAGMSK